MPKRQLLAVVRHGESQANAAIQAVVDDLYYCLAGADVEIGLTERGRRDATAAGTTLSRLFPQNNPLEAVYGTEFLRVRQTVECVLRELPYPVSSREDRRLKKRDYGLFWNLTHRGVRELHPAEWQRYIEEGVLSYRPPNGENYPDVFARVSSFIEEVLAPSSGNIAVVTHSVVALSFMRAFEALADLEVVRLYEEMALPNGAVLLFERQNRSLWRRIADLKEVYPSEASAPAVAGVVALPKPAGRSPGNPAATAPALAGVVLPSEPGSRLPSEPAATASLLTGCPPIPAGTRIAAAPDQAKS